MDDNDQLMYDENGFLIMLDAVLVVLDVGHSAIMPIAPATVHLS